MEPEKFLSLVWDAQFARRKAYVCLSYKTPEGRWKDEFFAYDKNIERRIKPWLSRHQDDDMYFCPVGFSQPRRKKLFALPSRFAWSDIDHGNWRLEKPSILWESSPGRFQGLWRFADMRDAEKAAQASKDIAYKIGADKGGWDITQVLRIPGTRNHKYPDKPKVKFKWNNESRIYNPKKSFLDKYKGVIPEKLFDLIRSPAEVGKRSETLWRIENQLLELKIPKPEIVAILSESPWNKFKGRSNEKQQLESELEKINPTPVIDESRDTLLADKFSSLTQLLSRTITRPKWLVEGFWPCNAAGIVAGEAKSFKSTVTMDLAFSVASGTPFLGKFPVQTQGPVLIVQNENSEHMIVDRVLKLYNSRKGLPKIENRGGYRKVQWDDEIPLHFLSETGFSLTNHTDREFLEHKVEEIKPVLIVLDPLYTMFTGNLNSSEELVPVLHWISSLKHLPGFAAVMVVHHLRKLRPEDASRAGQRLLGTSVLHNWLEVGWYLSRHERAEVQFNREFRIAANPDAVHLKFDMGEIGELGYNVDVRTEEKMLEEMDPQNKL